MTDYKVLKKDGTRARWDEVGIRTALSTRAAIQAILDSEEVEAGVYVAIPTRSFIPKHVEFETRIKVKFK